MFATLLSSPLLSSPSHGCRFFTSHRDPSTLLRKARANTTAAQLSKQFGRGAKAAGARGEPCDVAAYYLYTKEREGDAVGSGDAALGVEFLDKRGVVAFLKETAAGRRPGGKEAILQRYVVPKGGREAVVRATWSPQMCLLERRAALAPLGDVRRYARYERCATFGAPEHTTESAPLAGALLATRVQAACNAAAEHVRDAAACAGGVCYDVARMVLHFKLAEDDSLWLINCSSIRMAPMQDIARTHPLRQAHVDLARPLRLRPLELDFETTVHTDETHARQADASLASSICRLEGSIAKRKGSKAAAGKNAALGVGAEVGAFVCPACCGAFRPEERCEVTHKAAMALWGDGGGGIGDDAGGVQGWDTLSDFSAEGESEVAALPVPPALQRAVPRLTAEKFAVMRYDPTFLYRTMSVCTSCCLACNEAAMEALAKENPAVASAHDGRIHASARDGANSALRALAAVWNANKDVVRPRSQGAHEGCAPMSPQQRPWTVGGLSSGTAGTVGTAAALRAGFGSGRTSGLQRFAVGRRNLVRPDGAPPGRLARQRAPAPRQRAVPKELDARMRRLMRPTSSAEGRRRAREAAVRGEGDEDAKGRWAAPADAHTRQEGACTQRLVDKVAAAKGIYAAGEAERTQYLGAAKAKLYSRTSPQQPPRARTAPTAPSAVARGLGGLLDAAAAGESPEELTSHEKAFLAEVTAGDGEAVAL